jgi:hypothetical protein
MLFLMVDVGSKALFYCDGCIVNPPAALHPEGAAVISTYHIVWILSYQQIMYDVLPEF